MPLGTEYGEPELRYSLAIKEALNNYLTDKTMPSLGTLYGIFEQRLAIAIAENVDFGNKQGVTDGDKGDIVVSGNGTIWTVDNLPQSRITNLETDLAGKQASLVSGTNIKTVNGNSLLGTGDLTISGSSSTISTIRLVGTNGFGSSATTVHRWVTVDQSMGTDITYTDSATNGGSFTINTSGIYAITYTESLSNNAICGISKNATSLNSFFSSSAGLATATQQGGFWTDSVSWIGYLVAGDIIRAHVDGGQASGDASRCYFTITKLN